MNNEELIDLVEKTTVLVMDRFKEIEDKSGMPYSMHLEGVAISSENYYLNEQEEKYLEFSKEKLEQDVFSRLIPYNISYQFALDKLESAKYYIVGLAHDFVEDKLGTYEELRALGWDYELTSALDSVTRREGESYKDFIIRSRNNKIGCIVKKMDIKNNMDLDRMFMTPETEKKDLFRIKKYIYSYKYLNGELSLKQYLENV